MNLARGIAVNIYFNIFRKRISDTDTADNIVRLKKRKRGKQFLNRYILKTYSGGSRKFKE